MIDLQWNRAFALEQAGDDEELLAELLELLRSSSASDLAKIREAMAAGNAAAMGDAAHSIKGAAASLGIDQLSALAYAMEKAGRANDLEGAKQQFAALAEMVAALSAVK
ncbi:MAG: Hpt domain-containing protein [Desulfobulbaceae bacterium]|nr:Hpt domain-containing protein [Desulfobulbaceae bacterium]